MIIVAKFSFNNGEDYIINNYSNEYLEIKSVIESVDALACKSKVSMEKTMRGKKLYSPPMLNELLKKEFNLLGWYRGYLINKYPITL